MFEFPLVCYFKSQGKASKCLKSHQFCHNKKREVIRIRKGAQEIRASY